MKTNYLDFAECSRCGHAIPIRPSVLSSNGEPRKWTKTDGVSEFFLCTVCNRVVEIPPDGLISYPSIDGLWPDSEDAPLRVFEVPIECDVLGCEAQATVFVTRNCETTNEALRQESSQWILADLRCLSGHVFLGRRGIN